MDVSITEQMAVRIGIGRLASYGITPESFSWSKFTVVDLGQLQVAEARRLRNMLEEIQGKDLTGAGTALKDTETWLAVLEKPGGAHRMRKVEQFEALLVEYLLGVPGPRLYRRHAADRDAWLGYAVTRVEYHPEVRDSSRYHPANVVVTMAYESFGGQHQAEETYYHADIVGLTVEEALARANLYAETPELRGRYLAETKRYHSLIPLVGHQFNVDGFGSDNVPSGNDQYSRSTGSGGKRYAFRSDASKRNRVVVDVFREDGLDNGSRAQTPDMGGYFWASRRGAAAKRVGKDDVTADEEVKQDRYSTRTKKGLPAEDAAEVPENPFPPVHPFLVVFDLQRHLRLSVHVAYLREYVYDTALADKLVLPERMKRLVRMLVEHKAGGFVDIVAGKTGGAIVLLTGRPGVGKTLTAEVFAEAEQKPLFSVQASQLGTDPDELEKRLMLALARAERWGAVMLLDEADVYVRQRADDLIQNAIVGVFLRVLEYHAPILFMTTNRPDLVDDAIASRCVAKLDYPYPDAADQVRIWHILADNAGIALADSDVEEFARRHPDTSGRDVKNLLKLAALVSSADGEPIDLAKLEYVLQFKPTVSSKEAPA